MELIESVKSLIHRSTALFSDFFMELLLSLFSARSFVFFHFDTS